MSSKILIISEYFFPNERTDSFLLTEIAKKLAEVSSGNVQVICTSELGKSTEVKGLEGKVHRLKSIKLNEKKILFRIFKFILITIKLSLVSLFSIKKYDRVLLTTNPAFLIPIISIFRHFKIFEYTILVYDVFPENIAATNIMSNSGFFYRTIKKVYDWSYSKADRLIVLGRDMQEVVSNKTHQKVPIHLIENWCDYKSVIPKVKIDNKILQDLNLVNKKVFLFAGNLGRVQGIETLLKAADLVVDSEFVLLFIGDGVYKTPLMDSIKQNTRGNVYYAGSFPISEQNEFLNACDVSIISLNDSMYGLGVPSKSYYNMAAQKPILYIGANESEISKVISEFNIGWSISPQNEMKLALLIDKICQQTDAFTSIGRKAREVLIGNFSKEIILEKYAKLYKDKR